MKATQVSDNQLDPLEEQLIGINAKTAPYTAARSWSGGRKRILGKGPFESYCYHVKKDAKKRCQVNSACIVSVFNHPLPA